MSSMAGEMAMLFHWDEVVRISITLSEFMIRNRQTFQIKLFSFSYRFILGKTQLASEPSIFPQLPFYGKSQRNIERAKLNKIRIIMFNVQLNQCSAQPKHKTKFIGITSYTLGTSKTLGSKLKNMSVLKIWSLLIKH